MWRDPLDELIEDLERVVPQPASRLSAYARLVMKYSESAAFRPPIGPQRPSRKEEESIGSANDVTRNPSMTPEESADRAPCDPRTDESPYGAHFRSETSQSERTAAANVESQHRGDRQSPPQSPRSLDPKEPLLDYLRRLEGR